MTITKRLADEFDSLERCCLHEPVWKPSEVIEVLCWIWRCSYEWQDAPKTSSESESVALVRLTEGSYGVLTESEDYAGHGCQCSAATSRHPTLRAALEHGLDADQREAVARRIALSGNTALDLS